MSKTKIFLAVAVSAVVLVGAGLGVGDYVLRTGTSLPCGINADDINNSPSQFFTPGEGNGPVKGEAWNRWIDYDLSAYWLTEAVVTEVLIPVDEGIELEAWWVTASGTIAPKTIIVTHGYGASRRDFNTLLPTSMLVEDGFNVLLVDQRNTGGSPCTTGRHTAGQTESDDFAKVAQWAVDQGLATPERLGMFGVSGGGIATTILPAKTDIISAFAVETAIFNFSETATREVQYQGFPGFLWQLADAASKLRGVDLQKVPITSAVEALDGRPFLVLHGDADKRLAYSGALELQAYANQVGEEIRVERFVGADHTEGMLLETERYRELLTEFFQDALPD